MSRQRAFAARAIAGLLVSTIIAAGAPAAADGTSDSERGAAYLAPFKQDLMAALKSGLAEGPDAAIGACRIEAPAIAARHSHDGVSVGRSSHRLRNPDNAAPGWVSPVIDAWLDSDAREPRVVELDGNRLGYIEPIITQALCLTCHGEALAPSISERLEALYPADEATGFKAGDLRGVFWVEFAR